VRSGGSTIMKRKNDGARARRFGMDPAGFESLGHLHDTLSLPTPAPTLARLSDQIFDLHQQLAEAREDASIAHGVGLPTGRLQREIVWGEQCLNALLETWAEVGAETA
jgi:hypothetical protein